jgi:hypothetical protein
VSMPALFDLNQYRHFGIGIRIGIHQPPWSFDHE